MTELASTPSRTQRLKADSLLLLTAFIWGISFVAQRVAALNMGVYAFTGVRFLLGVLVLLPFAWRRSSFAHLRRGDLQGIALAGLLLFGGAALQQTGMRFTTASNAGFITGLYVVIIPLILVIGGLERPRPVVWLAAIFAASGLYLLSTGGQFSLARGDAWVLASAVLWASHVIWVGRLVQRLEPLNVAIGQYLVCGGLGLVVSLLFEGNLLPETSAGWGAVVYTGVLSVGVAYTLQLVGQRVAPPADAAILLNLEAVIAALTGWLILDERLTALQLLGCGLILAGMLLAQVKK